jgi:hypothetical protein
MALSTARDRIVDLVAAHGALTEAVTDAARLMTAHGYGKFAAHLDRHRAELNVAIGELVLWAESFGEWARVDVGCGVREPVVGDEPLPESVGSFGADLLWARETLKSRRTNVLSELANARPALHTAGLPVDELTTYRRIVRVWAGEAIDVVTGVHRLTLADRYIRSFRELRTDGGRHDAQRREGIALLRRWMQDLEEVDREGELALAESCGYGRLVEYYRSET